MNRPRIVMQPKVRLKTTRPRTTTSRSRHSQMSRTRQGLSSDMSSCTCQRSTPLCLRCKRIKDSVTKTTGSLRIFVVPATSQVVPHRPVSTRFLFEIGWCLHSSPRPDHVVHCDLVHGVGVGIGPRSLCNCAFFHRGCF